jgi:Cu-processing system permease protein
VRPAARVLRHELDNLWRSRWVWGYALLLLLLTDALLRFGGGGPRVVVSLLNVVLLFVPLVSLVFGAMYLYGAREFIELLLAQPVRRPALFVGLYGGLSSSLAAAFAIGVGAPFLWARGEGSVAGPLATLIIVGVLLTYAFVALAFLIALLFQDRAKGLGAAIAVWFAATALYDAVLVFVTTAFSDYPLETPLIGLYRGGIRAVFWRQTRYRPRR